MRSRLIIAIIVLGASIVHADLIGFSYNAWKYSLDTTTGAGTQVFRVSELNPNDIAYRNGLIYGQGPSYGSLYSVDLGTGAATQLFSSLSYNSTTFIANAMAFSPSGTLYAEKGAALYTIDLATGAVALVGNNKPTGSFDNYSGSYGMAFSPNGTLYGWDINYDQGLVTINTATGVATRVGAYGQGNADIQSLAFAPDGTLYGARRYLFTIDTTTGTPTQVGSAGIYDQGDQFWPTVISGADIRGLAFVPEPGSFALVGIGLLSFLRRRRQQATRLCS